VQRNGQVFIGFKCQSDFRDKIVDAAPGALSQFIRDAVLEKLARETDHVDKALAKAPSRVGVGGRPAHKGKGRRRYDALSASIPVLVNESEDTSAQIQQQQSVSYRTPKRKKK
jgi:hypothetical protein